MIRKIWKNLFIVIKYVLGKTDTMVGVIIITKMIVKWIILLVKKIMGDRMSDSIIWGLLFIIIIMVMFTMFVKLQNQINGLRRTQILLIKEILGVDE